MIFRNFVKTAVRAALLGAVLFCGTAQAGNSSGYAWGENAGWVNFSPAGGGGAAVYDDHLEGYVWHENIGWIRLGTFTAGTAHTYVNTANSNYGVNNDGAGTLSGYGWSENAGWVNFKPAGGGVRVAGGSFDGYAWGENVGWIHFKNTSPAYNVVTTWGGGTPPTTTTTTLPPAGGLPLAPSGLTAKSLSDTEILLAWTDSSSNETGFIIERADGIHGWEEAGRVGANVTSFTDTGLRYTWQYYYRVAAYNAAGLSAYSNGTSAWTWMFPYDECDGVALNGAVGFADVNLAENSPPGTVIGTFTTINPTGTHRYKFYPLRVLSL